MSLMKTLAKVAIGVAVAKGVSGMMNKKRSGSSGGGGLFGGTHSPGSGGQSRSGLEDLMGSVLGGGGTSGGGLGGLLEGLAGGVLGGASGGGGSTGGFSDALNQAFQKRDEPEIPPTPEQEDIAGLLLIAMIQAAKADGVVDEHERSKLKEQLGDISQEEMAFVKRAFDAPIDVPGLAQQVPRGMEQQVYAMSVIGINLDNRDEAQYLHDLAGAMGIGKEQVNHIHGQLGVPALYA